MQQDHQLKSLFERFDSCLEETPPSLQDPRLNKPIHRFRSPWAKFLEWVINGGATMFLVFFLVSLSSIFWNGASFGWVAVPLVIFVVRPIVGSKPLQQPVKMVLVTLLGVALSMSLAVVVDFAVRLPMASQNLYLLSFFIENSFLALLVPDYSVTILVIIGSMMALSRWVARRNPWLERQVRLGSARLRLSILCLTLAAFCSGCIAYQSEYRPTWYLVQQARLNPQMKNVAYGASLPEGAVRSLDFKTMAPSERRAEAQSLLLKYQEQPLTLTRSDLNQTIALLQTVEDDDPVFLDLWWELHCFSQDYFVGLDLTSVDNIEVQVPRRLFLSPELDPDLMQTWRTRLQTRPMRSPLADEELYDLCLVQSYLDAQDRRKGRTGVSRYKESVENRYLLQKELSSYQRLLSVYDAPFLASGDIRERYGDFQLEAERKFHSDLDRTLLLGILEARLHKATHGTYPEKVSTKLYGFEYRKTDDSAEFLKRSWNDKEEIVCRLPR